MASASCCPGSLQRAGRRSAVLHDVAVLTRRPVRATLVVIAASAALQRTSDAAAGWRGWVDHTLVILLIATVTWVAASLLDGRRTSGRLPASPAVMPG